MKVLYIAFSDFTKNPTSGSQVRSLRMLHALKEEADEVRYIDGFVNDYKQRRRECRKVKNWLQEGWQPDFCYIELPSGPIFFSCDYRLIRRIWRMKIPIAAFYRDAYWRFPNIFHEERNSILVKIKAKIIIWMQKRDWKMWKKYFKVIYFPSLEMTKFFDDVSAHVLPPGCERFEIVTRPENEFPVGIYVGGASEQYGVPFLLEIVRKINSQNVRIKINIVCPASGWKALINERPELLNISGVNVFHLDNGDELQRLYNESDFAIIPRKRNVYNDFAFPVKLVEYISHGLPIVTTDCTTSKEFVEKYSIGIVAEDKEKSFSDALLKMAWDIKHGKCYTDEVKNACLMNLWSCRVRQIIEDLNQNLDKY